MTVDYAHPDDLETALLPLWQLVACGGVRNNTPERRTATLTLARHDGLAALDAGRPADVRVPAESSVRRLYSVRPALVLRSTSPTKRLAGSPSHRLNTTG